MKPLKEEYHKDGLIQKVLSRDGNIAVAEVSDGERVLGYEVWIVQQGTEREIDGEVIPASEFPPSAREWGVKGWTYRTLEEALVAAMDRADAERDKVSGKEG